MVALPERKLQIGEREYLEEVDKAQEGVQRLKTDVARAVLPTLQLCRDAAETLMRAGYADGKQFGLHSSLQQQQGGSGSRPVELQETYRKVVFDIVDEAIDDASALIQAEQFTQDGVIAVLQLRMIQTHARLLATIHAAQGATAGIILGRHLRDIAEIIRYLEMQ